MPGTKIKKAKINIVHSQQNNFLNNTLKHPYLLVFILGAAVYLQVIAFSYTGFDDDFLIFNNLKNLKDLSNIGSIFFNNSFLSKDVFGFYRPLQTLSFMFDTFIGSGSYWPFHLTNLILFLIANSLIYFLLSKLDFTKEIALIGSLIFTVHPLFSIDVAWLPARGDLLIAVFCLSAFIFMKKYENSKKIFDLIFHLFFLFMGFLSKETAILFPIILLAYLLLIEKEKISNLWIYIISWSGLVFIWYLLRSLSIQELPQGQIFGILPFLENLRTIPEVIGKFIIPVNIMPLPIFNSLNTLIGIIVIIAIAILFFIQKNKDTKIILFGLIWFFVLILPGMFYSRNYPFSVEFYNYLDHRDLLSMIGIYIIVISLITPYFKNIKERMQRLIVVILIIIFSLLSFNHVKIFSAPLKFLGEAIKSNPNASTAYFLKGNIWKKAGNLSAAIMEYSQAIRINPKYSQAYNNRGSLYGITGQYRESIEDLTRAIELDPKIPDGYLNRGLAREYLENYRGAIADYNKSIELSPDDSEIYFYRANAKSKIGLFNDAINDYTEAIKLNPDNYEYYFDRANAKSSLNNLKDAIPDYSYAIALNPNFTAAYINRAINEYQLKDYTAACKDWQKAMSMGSNEAMQMFSKYCKGEKSLIIP